MQNKGILANKMTILSKMMFLIFVLFPPFYTCLLDTCKLCKPCQTPEDLQVLHSAVMELRNQRGGKYLRIYPRPPGTQAEARRQMENMNQTLSKESYKMHLWYLKKCLRNSKWCVDN